MAFRAGDEDNEKETVCSFCRESKKNEPGSRRAGSRRNSKSKKEKTAEARSANDDSYMIFDQGHYIIIIIMYTP